MSEAETSGALRRGLVLDGRYRVEEEVGAGAMGRVYRVVHETLQIPLALKILHPELAVIPEVRQRIEREARLSALLDHPTLVRVTDFGVHEGRPFLVMRLVEGEELAARMERGPMGAHEVTEIGIELCDGLAHAHGMGLVHRDLKPDNVLLTSRGVRILDFGLARAIASDDPRLTRNGLVCGTPRYMSPEQASGDPIDARSDLYAVGVLLHEMLSGEPLFDGPNAAAVLKKQIVEVPPPLALPQDRRVDGKLLLSTIDRALAKDVTQRYPDAKTLEADLKGCLHLERQRGTSRKWAVAGLAAAVLAVGGFVYAAASDPLLEARTALSAGQLPVAEDALRQRLAEDPRDPEAKLLLGHLAYRRGRTERAAEAWLAALKIEPSLAGDGDLTDTLPDATAELHRSSRNGRGLAERLVEAMAIGAPGAAQGTLMAIAQEAPSPSLRRIAFEGLERAGATSGLDVFDFLTRGLEAQAESSCQVRKWYVERIARLSDPRGTPLVRKERSRRRSSCLADL
ncbi:MAG: protein kinase [Myxococcota bacterium]